MSSEKNKYSELTMLRIQKYNIATMEDLGMNWYKFNIYFRLFFGIVTLLSDIANILMNYVNYGNSWGISWNIDVYLCFAIIFDVILIVGTILTRHWLAYFNKKGVQLYFITQYLSQVVSFIAILILLGFDENSFPQTLGSLIVYGIFFAFEYKYWKKRSHLFSDKNQSTYVNGNESVSTQIKTPNFKNFTVCIYDTVDKNIRNEERTIDTNKFPSEKYAVDGIYYAIEKMNNDKKVRVYCSKSSWQSQIDNQTTEKRKIRFCRKCGFELIDDSEFCSQCGTKIIKNVEMIQNEVL